MFKFIILTGVLVFFLVLCVYYDSARKEPPKKENPVQAASVIKQSDAPAMPSVKPSMDPRVASQILAFQNRATDSFTSGYYSLPRSLADNASRYLENFTLPKKVSVPARSSLTPPEEGFSGEETQKLADISVSMDKSLRDMLDNYRKLEAYVRDEKIRDDGKLGHELANRIQAGHETFMAASKTWLEIVENRAAEAESALLEDHPLRRQALAARSIFAIIAQVSGLLSAGDVDRQLLGSLRQGLDQSIAEGEKPPFPASPSLERLYRGFLKNAQAYSAALAACENEGAFAPQKKALIQAAQACRRAYNSFAHAVNSAPQN